MKHALPPLALALAASAASGQLASSPQHTLQGLTLNGGSGVLVSHDFTAALAVGGELGWMATEDLQAWIGVLPSGDPLAPGPPVVVAVEPSFGHHDGGTGARVHGLHLGHPSTSVLFGGVPALSLGGASATFVDVTTPAGTRGPADVTVEAVTGSDALAGGFVYTPAVRVSPAVAVGEALTVENFGIEPLSFTTAFATTTTELPLPPYGTLLIGPAGIATLLDWTAFDTEEHVVTEVDIPANPALVGATLHFQSAMLYSLLPPVIELTNRSSTVLVEP
ncbi:MAG: IPT/TIG domain-containing protein [Planctomycetota bacterium]